MRGVVLDGVTGAGKSHLLAALGRRGLLEGATVVPEEETLGEAMDEELRDPALSPARKTWRLGRVLERVEAAPPGQRFVLERFHPTYHALLPDWPLYAPLDARLAGLGFGLVLLTVEEGALAGRALHRVDRPGWAEGMSAYYGSEAAALEAIVQSQRRRLEALERTRMPALRLDTTAADWERAAESVGAFMARATP